MSQVTLRGLVLPVGGVKEKVIGAHRAGVRMCAPAWAAPPATPCARLQPRLQSGALEAAALRAHVANLVCFMQQPHAMHMPCHMPCHALQVHLARAQRERFARATGVCRGRDGVHLCERRRAGAVLLAQRPQPMRRRLPLHVPRLRPSRAQPVASRALRAQVLEVALHPAEAAADPAAPPGGEGHGEHRPPPSHGNVPAPALRASTGSMLAMGAPAPRTRRAVAAAGYVTRPRRGAGAASSSDSSC